MYSSAGFQNCADFISNSRLFCRPPSNPVRSAVNPPPPSGSIPLPVLVWAGHRVDSHPVRPSVSASLPAALGLGPSAGSAWGRLAPGCGRSAPGGGARFIYLLAGGGCRAGSVLVAATLQRVGALGTHVDVGLGEGGDSGSRRRGRGPGRGADGRPRAGGAGDAAAARAPPGGGGQQPAAGVRLQDGAGAGRAAQPARRAGAPVQAGAGADLPGQGAGGGPGGGRRGAAGAPCPRPAPHTSARARPARQRQAELRPERQGGQRRPGGAAGGARAARVPQLPAVWPPEAGDSRRRV